MSHECPRDGCTKTVSAEQLMCPQDWRRVPKPIRNAVWAAWKDGAGAGTPAHQAAIEMAIRAVNGGTGR